MQTKSGAQNEQAMVGSTASMGLVAGDLIGEITRENGITETDHHQAEVKR